MGGWTGKGFKQGGGVWSDLRLGKFLLGPRKIGRRMRLEVWWSLGHGPARAAGGLDHSGDSRMGRGGPVQETVKWNGPWRGGRGRERLPLGFFWLVYFSFL